MVFHPRNYDFYMCAHAGMIHATVGCSSHTVKMATGDQLTIAKETSRRLGMRTNMYPSSLDQDKDASITTLPVDELIEKADGFAGVFPEHKYEIVKKLQERKHFCGMAGDRVNDALTLKKADIGIVVVDAPDAVRDASDIILKEPGLRQSFIKGILSRARGRPLIISPSLIYAVQCGSQWPEQLLLKCITSI